MPHSSPATPCFPLIRNAFERSRAETVRPRPFPASTPTRRSYPPPAIQRRLKLTQFTVDQSKVAVFWNHVGGRRFVTYTNLLPGEYTLRIKAANKDGVWNEKGATLHISIKPPLWQTLWFRSLAIMSAVLLLVLLYFIRVHRIKVRNRHLEQAVAERTSELQQALAEVKTLAGMLPICASCKRIRDDEGYWQQVEVYIKEHSQADFSHSICPECTRELYPDFYDEIISHARSHRTS